MGYRSRFKGRRRISRRNEESGSKARPRGRKAAGPVVEERGAGEQADKYFSLDAKKYFPSTREIFSRSRPRNFNSQHPLWQGRSQTLRPGIVDILQTVEHLSSSFHSGGKMLFFRGLPDFFGTFSRSAFLVNKRSLFLPKCQ